MLTSQNIVEPCASVHSASLLLVLVTSRLKTIIDRFARSSTNWAKEEYKIVFVLFLVCHACFPKHSRTVRLDSLGFASPCFWRNKGKQHSLAVLFHTSSYLCSHRPIFPVRLQTSIVGIAELNFCVRNGYRWTLCNIDTNCLRQLNIPFVGIHWIPTVFASTYLPGSSPSKYCRHSRA